MAYKSLMCEYINVASHISCSCIDHMPSKMFVRPLMLRCVCGFSASSQVFCTLAVEICRLPYIRVRIFHFFGCMAVGSHSLRWFLCDRKQTTPSMMKIHVSLSLEEVDLLKSAHSFFGCDDGEVLSASELVVWSVGMVIAAHEHEAK